MKYKISQNTVRKANKTLIQKGITEKTRNNYNGNINVKVKTKTGYITKSFSNSDIKTAYEKAKNIYAERI